VSEERERASARDKWGAGYLTFDFGYQYAIGSDSTHWNTYAFGLAAKGSGVPIRYSLSAFLGSGRVNGASNDAATTLVGYAIGLAFAPFSIPNAATSATSVLNPWIGGNVKGWSASRVMGEGESLHGGNVIALSIGNVIIARQLGIFCSYELGLIGSGSYPISTFTIGLAYGYVPPK
jgi:hypothetical protein